MGWIRRHFEITDYYILFKVPQKPEFKIKWSDFDRIEIQREKKYAGKSRRTYCKILFVSRDEIKEFVFYKGRDYRIRTTKILLDNLEKSAPFKLKFIEKSNRSLEIPKPSSIICS